MADEELNESSGIDLMEILGERIKQLRSKKIKARSLDKRIMERLDEVVEFVSDGILQYVEEKIEEQDQDFNVFLVADIDWGIADWEKKTGFQLINLLNDRGEKATLYWFIFQRILHNLAQKKIEYSINPFNMNETISLVEEEKIEIPEWALTHREIPYLFLKRFYKWEALQGLTRDPNAGEDLEEFEAYLDLRELENETLGLGIWVFNENVDIPVAVVDTLRRWAYGDFKDKEEEEVANETNIIFNGTAFLEGYGAFNLYDGELEDTGVIHTIKREILKDFCPDQWVACRKDRLDELIKAFKKGIVNI